MVELSFSLTVAQLSSFAQVSFIQYNKFMSFNYSNNSEASHSVCKRPCSQSQTQAPSGIILFQDQKQFYPNFFQSRFIICNKETQLPLTANPYCSFCMKVVSQHPPFYFWQSDSNHCYVAHDECMKIAQEKGNYPRQSSIPVSSFVRKPVGINRSSQEIKNKEECCLQIVLKHPLTDCIILSLAHRGFLEDNSIEVNFDELSLKPSYLPNSLCLPAIDFFLEVNIIEIGTGVVRKMKKYFDFGVLKSQINPKEYEVENEQVKLRVIATADSATKEQWMGKMEYKYPYPEAEMIVKVLGFRFNFNDEEDRSSNQDNFERDQQTADNIQSQDLKLSSRREAVREQIKLKLFSSEQRPKSKTKLNLEKILKANKLIAFLKSNTHTRVFQESILSFSAEQIQSLVNKLESSSVMHELVMHEYANYSVQKLFQVATQSQKRNLFVTLLPYIRQIAQSKQGTHTLQRFLEHLGKQLISELSNAVGNELRMAFYDLCCDANATHFVQKCIELLKFEELREFISFAFENIAYFGVNKHSICVIKSMLWRLRDEEKVDQFSEQIVQHVTMNLDCIICDPFGNYAIQSIFENVNETCLESLSGKIASNFKKYSLNTYAANVLVRCLEEFWIGGIGGKLNPRCYELQLNDFDLYEMLISKESNKVLACLLNKGLMADRIVNIYEQCDKVMWNVEKWKRIVKKYLKGEQNAQQQGSKCCESQPSEKTRYSFEQTQSTRGAVYRRKR